MSYRDRDGFNKDLRMSSEPEAGGTGGGDQGGTYFLNPVINDGRRTSSAAPAPTLGDRYIVPVSPTGGWPGGGRIVEGNGGGWTSKYGEDGARTYASLQLSPLQLLTVIGSTYSSLNGNATIGTDIEGQYWIPDHMVDALHSILAEFCISRTTTAPPFNPPNYSRYIIPAGATGAWSGRTNQIALSQNEQNVGTSGWVFRTPTGGELAWVNDAKQYVWYDATSSSWKPLAANMRYRDLLDVTGPFDGSTDGYLVKWNNSSGKMELVASGASTAHPMLSHTDANWVQNAGNDQKVVTYDYASDKFILTSKSAASLALDDLTDVVAPSPTSGQALIFNGTNWVPGNPAPAAHNHTLDSLSNVSTGGKLNGDLLQWNGTFWVAKTLNLDDLGDVNTSGVAVGQVLGWNGSAWVPVSPSTAAAFTGCRVVGTPPSNSPNTAGTRSSYFENPSGILITSNLFGSPVFNGCFLVPSGYTKMCVFVEVESNAYSIAGAVGEVPPGLSVNTVANSMFGNNGGSWSTGGVFTPFRPTWATVGYSRGCYWSPVIPVTAGKYYYPMIFSPAGSIHATVKSYGCLLWP